MKNIIKWLRKIEKLANEVYLLGAEIYADDPEFKKFLENAAEDEAWHYHVMGTAAEHFVSKPAPIPAISIDEVTSGKILKYMSDMRDGLERKTISKDELIQKIVEVELLEWNDIFIYVVNVLKEQSSGFKYPAARIQAHIKKFEYFLINVYNRPDLLNKITAVPPVWIENILIVDDEQLIANLIKSLLNRSGNIDFAQNGQEALELIEKKFYKLIICDIDMPIMDGLSLFKEAVAKFPKLNSRFLFMTGYLSKEKRAFFTENRVKVLEKPMQIKVLREEASKIILSK
jgi:CheY-like chemotaxis protein